MLSSRHSWRTRSARRHAAPLANRGVRRRGGDQPLGLWARALVSESLLRHHEEIPALFVYVDGSPLDERKIDAFAFKLQRTPTRALPDSKDLGD